MGKWKKVSKRISKGAKRWRNKANRDTRALAPRLAGAVTGFVTGGPVGAVVGFATAPKGNANEPLFSHENTQLASRGAWRGGLYGGLTGAGMQAFVPGTTSGIGTGLGNTGLGGSLVNSLGGTNLIDAGKTANSALKTGTGAVKGATSFSDAMNQLGVSGSANIGGGGWDSYGVGGGDNGGGGTNWLDTLGGLLGLGGGGSGGGDTGLLDLIGQGLGLYGTVQGLGQGQSQYRQDIKESEEETIARRNLMALRDQLLTQLGQAPTPDTMEGYEAPNNFSMHDYQEPTPYKTSQGGDVDEYRQKLFNTYMRESEPRLAADLFKRGLAGSTAYGTGMSDLTSGLQEKAYFGGETLRQQQEAERMAGSQYNEQMRQAQEKEVMNRRGFNENLRAQQMSEQFARQQYGEQLRAQKEQEMLSRLNAIEQGISGSRLGRLTNLQSANDYLTGLANLGNIN